MVGIEAPKRAKYIRTIISELARISSHLLAVGALAMDVGALTVFTWTFTEREKLYDIFELLTGARFTTSFTRVGGLAHDMTPEVHHAIEQFIDQLPSKFDNSIKMLNTNRIFIERMEGVGVITKEKAIALGMSGPNIRGTGIEHDIRRKEPYLVYNELDFTIPVFHSGDCLSRYYVRVNEVKESIKIVRQCLEKIPAGPVHANAPKKVLPRKERVYTKMEELIHDFMIINFGVNPPVGEVYHAVEGSKGELGFYIQSRGEGHPWRLKIRSPSFMNLQSTPHLVEGGMISDIVAVLGSLDPVMGEADK